MNFQFFSVSLSVVFGLVLNSVSSQNEMTQTPVSTAWNDVSLNGTNHNNTNSNGTSWFDESSVTVSSQSSLNANDTVQSVTNPSGSYQNETEQSVTNNGNNSNGTNNAVVSVKDTNQSDLGSSTTNLNVTLQQVDLTEQNISIVLNSTYLNDGSMNATNENETGQMISNGTNLNSTDQTDSVNVNTNTSVQNYAFQNSAGQTATVQNSIDSNSSSNGTNQNVSITDTSSSNYNSSISSSNGTSQTDSITENSSDNASSSDSNNQNNTSQNNLTINFLNNATIASSSVDNSSNTDLNQNSTNLNGISQASNMTIIQVDQSQDSTTTPDTAVNSDDVRSKYDPRMSDEAIALAQYQYETSAVLPIKFNRILIAINDQKRIDHYMLLYPGLFDLVNSFEYFIPNKNGPSIPVTIYVPSTYKRNNPIIMFYHGGSFMFQTRLSVHPAVTHMAYLTGCAFVSVEYRLAPENRFSAGLDDSKTATLFVAANKRLISPLAALAPIGVMGASAGANFASVIANELKNSTVKFQILLYGVFDTTTLTPSRVEFNSDPVQLGRNLDLIYFRTKQDKFSPRFNSIKGVTAATPKSLLIACELDSFRDDTTILMKIALDAKKVYYELHVINGMTHGYFGCSDITPNTFHQTIDYISNFISNL